MPATGYPHRSEARTLAKNSEKITSKAKYMGKLKGKIALITGGNGGIGLATTLRFIAEGADVFITETELFVDGGLAQV